MKAKVKVLLSLCLLWGGMAQAQQHVFLSALGCDRTGNGTQESPYHSLNKALENRLGTGEDTLFVEVASGDYFMNTPLAISQATTRPVVIRAQGKQKPRFIGGVALKNWEKSDNGIYRTFIPEVLKYGFTFEQFYVNGHRATLARTPNEGFFQVKGVKETVIEKGQRFPKFAVQRITSKASDMESFSELPKDALKDLKARFYHHWDITQKPVYYMNTDSAAFYLSGEGLKPWNPVRKGARYFFYDYFKALDTPGEWFLDRKSGYLYYYPKAGENMDTAECIAPALKQLVVLKGDAGEAVENISFEGLSFQYTSYIMPATGNEPMQAAARIEAAVEFDFVRNISLNDCELMHTGAYGLWIRRACYQNTVDHCYLADLGAGGIKVGETVLRKDNLPVTSHNVINNCIITDAGSVFPCAVGIPMFHTAHNKVTHNEISNLRYSGISVGWVWGYGFSPSVDNLVAYNHIHHIGWGEMSDMGAVYTLGKSYGTRIVNNVIHDVVSYDYGGWGLYTDEGSTDVEMSSNLVYRCKSGGFHQHYGEKNRIENNIFAFGHFFQSQMTKVEKHLSFSFKHNIIVQDRGETLKGPWDKGLIDMDNNAYWAYKGDLSFNKMNFKEWQKLKDKHSVVRDPKFADPYADDFHFRSKAVARKIGFKVFDYTQAGVYGSDAWKNKAKLSDEIKEEFKKAVSDRLK